MKQQSMDLTDIFNQYGSMSKECAEAMINCSELIFAEKGERVVKQGEMCSAFYINRNGLMRVVLQRGNVEDTFMFGTTGDIYTSMHSWCLNEPSAFSLIAVEDTEIYVISYSSMRRLMEHYPDLVRWLLEICFLQLYSLERRYIMYSSNSAEERLKIFLSRDEIRTDRVPVKTMMQRVPLKQIASYLKITPETLSRLRRKLVSKKE